MMTSAGFFMTFFLLTDNHLTFVFVTDAAGAAAEGASVLPWLESWPAELLHTLVFHRQAI